eukprot:CAMPEP_0172574180 /NCGR_PEP_ID=MMETSP1067-20121228/136568_1 /TAXON_ID=265564 ORGANISM="Thalassiosira punctigera, Strain Tpunct2005C2" /NCGR_SAMPLE_ID=MMETSP1067 /ASSEMBLY_ACC=CAM_ASM_000444 /LENGTH=607 /DNA_ID=CAMNT_0013366803 /DNA_START=80 /DNA_END=1906 /DNA_ORIENTATION=+
MNISLTLSIFLLSIHVSVTSSSPTAKAFAEGADEAGGSKQNLGGGDAIRRTSLLDPSVAPRRELSGKVIIKRKTPARLKKEGNTDKEIKEIRERGKSQIAKSKVVYESVVNGGDDDFQVVEVPGGKGNEGKFIEALMKNPEPYEFVEPDYVEYPDAIDPNDPLRGNQWHHGVMQSREAWSINTGSESVTVAICDTGIDTEHPDLKGNRLEGYNAVSGLWENNGGAITAVHPHGTMCAGCPAAMGNNNVGIAGVGWNFKHRPGRVSDTTDGNSNSSILADCARKMCEKEDVKVVSVSYSGPETLSRRSAATYCKSQGALMVNSAGNDDRDLTQYGQADNDDLIVVGATTSSDFKSSFSAYGTYVDVWAPGISVYSTTRGGGYTYVSGTSFSCPLTAGVIALIWSANPELTPDQVEAILKEGTDGSFGTNPSPYGRINSLKSLQLLGPVTSSPTKSPVRPTPSPTKAPVTQSPTKSPVPPTPLPTKAPVPPTPSPTKAPVTQSPTKSPVPPTPLPTKAPVPPTPFPTDRPTQPPTNFECSSIRRKDTCNDNVLCKWEGSLKTGNCVENSGAGPGPSPPGCAVSGDSCRDVPCCDGSTCPGGKPSRRVCP